MRWKSIKSIVSNEQSPFFFFFLRVGSNSKKMKLGYGTWKDRQTLLVLRLSFFLGLVEDARGTLSVRCCGISVFISVSNAVVHSPLLPICLWGASISCRKDMWGAGVTEGARSPCDWVGKFSSEQREVRRYLPGWNTSAALAWSRSFEDDWGRDVGPLSKRLL